MPGSVCVVLFCSSGDWCNLLRHSIKSLQHFSAIAELLLPLGKLCLWVPLALSTNTLSIKNHVQPCLQQPWLPCQHNLNSVSMSVPTSFGLPVHEEWLAGKNKMKLSSFCSRVFRMLYCTSLYSSFKCPHLIFVVSLLQITTLWHPTHQSVSGSLMWMTILLSSPRLMKPPYVKMPNKDRYGFKFHSFFQKSVFPFWATVYLLH